MPHVLWLAFETPPHPDAVVAAVTPEIAPAVLQLLSLPLRERLRYTAQLRNWLSRRGESPAFDSVACRLPGGAVRFLTWRLAKWLSPVLPAEDAVLERTAARIRRWLHADRCAAVVRPLSS